MRMTTIARTRRMWISPDAVYAVANPKAYKHNRITATVQSILMELLISHRVRARCWPFTLQMPETARWRRMGPRRGVWQPRHIWQASAVRSRVTKFGHADRK